MYTWRWQHKFEMMAIMTRGREDAGFGKRFFLVLLGLAGLGVGVWLFRRRKVRRSS